MKKLANHIILSGVTVSMLLSPMVAADKPLNPNQLPSGGKFTHGTSGTINTNGNNMYINGTTVSGNHVIQWGGGFNIGKDAQVHFGKGQSGQNYLNIAHGTDKSTIEGLLNAGGNNVFLINPNGVIITKTGTINANRFVASTSSMSDGDMTAFANMKNFNDGLSFSPIFKPQKAGNVVNMGNINANNVLLIGNKVDIQGGNINGMHNEGVSGDALKDPSGNTANKVHLVGNEVYIDKDMAKFKTTSGKVDVTANAIYIQRQMINFANDGYEFGGDIKDKINITNYQNHKGNSNFKKALTIGNMGDEKKNAIEWWHFAKGWNEGLGVREIDEFRLVDDIDFGANCKNGVCTGQNYANYWVDLNGDGVKQDNEFASMIVGKTYDSTFTKTFDGQGFALNNIHIDTSLNNVLYVGIFGSAENATFKNINVDYENGSIIAPNSQSIGGFIGRTTGSNFSNITLNNIKEIKNVTTYRGSEVYVGGFAGEFSSSKIDKISLYSMGDILVDHRFGSSWYGNYVGGFIGWTSGNSSFNNIVVQLNGKIESKIYSENTWNYVGGFIGSLQGTQTFENIYLFLNPNVELNVNNATEQSVGKFYGSNVSDSSSFKNIYFYYKNGTLSSANADNNIWGSNNNTIKIYDDKDESFSEFQNKHKLQHNVSLEEDDLNKEVITQII
ncbi:TPA: filamentous hemagglutinin N-terminal domain-containing protein, partial [Campylobacter lari]|nr:filamentous hemagglutinin N-terminal domain-containing protein [Campylobacter lari]